MTNPQYRVLLIEDDEILAKILASQFRNDGIECFIAATGEEALEKLKVDTALDAVLLDISLPGIDGFEVLSRIKNDPRVASIPVIIISNFSQDKDIAWGKKLGAEKFISKVSVAPADIVSTTSECIANRRNAPPMRENLMPK